MSVSAVPQTVPAPPPLLADRRVEDLGRLIDSGDFDVLSLDVFDTLVWRMTPEPSDVFFLVGQTLRERGSVYESSTPESFVRERIHAELRARKRMPTLEVTLGEIYAEFPRGYLRGIAPADVAGLEFEIERRVVRPYPALVDLVHRARRRGMRAALVSDTYFTRAQIRELTGVAVDFVIVSSEHRLPKRLGLHRVLIEASGARPERVLHVGDNFAADVEGPADLSMARYWFRRFPDEYREMVAAELPEPFSQRARFVADPDHGITSLRGRAMFTSATAHERWGAGVLGPVVAGFCDWVAQRCEALGIGTALCLMREGRILRQVLGALGSGLDAREFYVSRYVALKAAILDGSESEILRFISRASSPRLGTLLDQLGLAAADVRGDDHPLAHHELETLARRIAGDRTLRTRVVRASATARARLLRHLESADALDGTVAIVDLGYSGTIQECLQRILDRERPDLRTHGLYLVTGDAHRAQAAGCAVEGWLAENHQPVAMAHTFIRSPEVVEQSLMADCGTTLGHDADGTPVLDTPRVPGVQRGEVAAVQAGILSYARLWASHRAEHGAPNPAMVRRLAQAIAIRAVARPLDAELALFAYWQHDENLGSTATRTLAGIAGQHPWEASHISAHQIASLPSGQVYWPFGYAAALGPTMRDAVASIYLRTAGPTVFGSALRPRPIRFFWDAGDGFDPRQCTTHDCTLGNRGRAWQRFSLAVRDGALRSLALAIGAPGELVQLTGVRLHVRPERGAVRTDTFEHDALETVGYETLGANLYRVTEEPALILVPFVPVTGFTGLVELDVFFAIVELA